VPAASDRARAKVAKVAKAAKVAEAAKVAKVVVGRGAAARGAGADDGAQADQ